MPWIEADFATKATADGMINQKKRLKAPASGNLRKYKVKTTNGCKNRSHPTSLLVKRVSDSSDTLAINIDIADCTDYEKDIDHPYQVHAGEEYDISLTSKGFDNGEPVKGYAAVNYTLFFVLE